MLEKKGVFLEKMIIKTMLNKELKIQYTQIKTKFFLSKLVTAIGNVRPNFSGQGLTEGLEGL